MSEKNWALLGRVSIILTLLLSPLALIPFCHRNPAAALVARVEYSEFALPDDVASVDKCLENAIGYKQLSEQLDLKFLQEEFDRGKVVSGISSYLSEALGKCRPGIASSAKNLCVATVTNDGDRLAKGVSIEFSSSIAARVNRSNGKSSFAYGRGPIEIGDVSVQESVKVFAWSFSAPYGEPKLVHADGIGKVSVYEPLNPFWSSVRQTVRFGWPALILLPVFVAVVIAGWWQARSFH